jgi:hypothetical protein
MGDLPILVLRKAAPALRRGPETAQRSLSRMDWSPILVLRKAAPLLRRGPGAA